jgi:hypothetical protein
VNPAPTATRPKGLCYRCDSPGTTREHFPPKAFFPRNANLNLKTIPSCEIHNNGKSHDDQYVLAHVSMHAACGDNLAARVFKRSILPQLDFPKFREQMTDGAHPVEGGVAYPIDERRLDSFFDALTSAAFFCEFGICLDESMFRMRHVYLSIHSKDPAFNAAKALYRSQVAPFFERHRSMIKQVESAKIDEVIYGHTVVAPAGVQMSITIGHTFYGSFEVVSLLTNLSVHRNLARED